MLHLCVRSLPTVSIHAPVRERPRKLSSIKRRMVSIHAPVGERRNVFHATRSHNCFNSRSHEGATPISDKHTASTQVSIHAPVKERLFYRRVYRNACDVSIHAPVRERRFGADAFSAEGVSIHAPVKERRWIKDYEGYEIMFQFTLP